MAVQARGRTTPEIPRLLKRAAAREVFKSLTRGLAKNMTLRAAATAMNTYPTRSILRTERGTFPGYDLADRYRAWLKAA
jgi:transposase